MTLDLKKFPKWFQMLVKEMNLSTDDLELQIENDVQKGVDENNFPTQKSTGYLTITIVGKREERRKKPEPKLNRLCHVCLKPTNFIYCRGCGAFTQRK